MNLFEQQARLDAIVSAEASAAMAVELAVTRALKRMPTLRGYTAPRARKNGMHYSKTRCCPECGCPWYGNKNDCGKGHRTCCDCWQEWWMHHDYTPQAARRELPEV